MSFATMMAAFSSMNNPLMTQVMLSANKPRFQGTVIQFPEFQRQWKEYCKILRTIQPGMPEGQLLVLFKDCLDSTTASQLRREMENNPRLTVTTYMKTLAKTFGQDASGQARQAWCNVKLNLRGDCLDWNTWREFQQQFEVASERVDDKAEREEFDMLFKQLPIFWQDKVVRDGHKRTAGKHWVKLMSIPGAGKETIEELLEGLKVDIRQIKETHGGFNIQGKTEEDEETLIDMSGGKLGGNTIKIIRTRMQLEAADVFRMIGDHLRAADEAEALRMSMGGRRKATTAVTRRDSREGTPNRERYMSDDYPPRRSQSPLEFTPRAPDYPPPAVTPQAVQPQYVQYVARPAATIVPPPAPMTTTIHRLPYQVWDPFAAIWTDTPGSHSAAVQQVTPAPVVTPVAPTLPPATFNQYPRNDWDSWNVSDSKGKGKGKGKGNKGQQDQWQEKPWDQPYGQNKGDSKGKGKSQGKNGPKGQGPNPNTTTSTGRTPFCQNCADAGRASRHEEALCSFRFPQPSQSVA